jgi:mannose-6-phosphate isomerase-like protein (cupin superfamily)
MADVQGHVVAWDEIEAQRVDGDTAETHVAVDASDGSRLLEQRVVRFGPGKSQPQAFEGRQAILYVVEGSGSLEVDGRSYDLERETAAYVPEESFVIDNSGPDDLLMVIVTAPAAGGPSVDPDPRTVRLSDRGSLPAGKDREFRYLVHRDTGCPDVTQFVGVIPPGRAPDHSHVYDEVVYVLEGRGRLHIDGKSTPIGPGTCMHLPPLLEHALENETDGPMRVLGVFHPSGDPASRASEANE